MPRHVLLCFAAAGSLLLQTACRDAAAPQPESPQAPAATPSQPVTPQPPIDAIWLGIGPDGLAAVAGDSLVLSGRLLHGYAETADTLTWESSDPSTASVEVVEKNIVLLRTFKSGSLKITARTQRVAPELSRQVVLQVFARSNRASPIVVDEFSLLQLGITAERLYAPKLRLRDTSAAGTARVIGLAIDIPEMGWSLFCSPDRTVGGGWSAFNPPGDMNYGLFVSPRSTQRVGPPMVRVIARLSDGLAVSSSVTGTTELGEPNWKWYDGPDTGVRCGT